jgi:hypothetical protein
MEALRDFLGLIPLVGSEEVPLEIRGTIRSHEWDSVPPLPEDEFGKRLYLPRRRVYRCWK